MERHVADVLASAGDHGGAFLWRRICRDLAGGLRIGVAATDASVCTRLIGTLETLVPADWIALPVDPEAGPGLGTADRLLGLHVLLWATPAGAPLGAEERDAIDAMIAAGAPGRSAIVLADWHVLARLSDDPEREGGEILERARALAPTGWPMLRPDDVAPFLEQARRDLPSLVLERRATVSQLLLEDALGRAAREVELARTALAELDALAQAEDATIHEVQRRGRRAGAHLRSAVRRQTELLKIDLGRFLTDLEAAIPAEVASVPDDERVRRALPHWLQHVVERWLGDRLAEWRLAVHGEIADMPLTEADLDRAELLAPAVHPPPLAGERDWTTRLGATAALGGGVALLLMGLWAPGLVAVGSGLGWSALRGAARSARTREALTRSAVDALQRLGPELARILDDQVRATEDALANLGDERAQAHRDARADAIADLERRRSARADRVRELEEVAAGLDARIAALRPVAEGA